MSSCPRATGEHICSLYNVSYSYVLGTDYITLGSASCIIRVVMQAHTIKDRVLCHATVVVGRFTRQRDYPQQQQSFAV